MKPKNSKYDNDCVGPRLFPKTINNRPGLPRVDYRIGEYADFREHLLRKLNVDAVLSEWTHRTAEDPGIALLEGASILGDILTFYQNLYANEAFLRTAQWRESIADLVKLLGYRLAPGVGGRGIFAFEVSGDKSVTVPAGFPVKAELEELDESAEFETVNEFTAVPALSRFRLYRPFEHPEVVEGASTFAIETQILTQKQLELNAGDRLMLVAGPPNGTSYRQVAVIQETQSHFEHTEIIIEGSWQGPMPESNITAYKLGRSFRYFGHNGPETVNTLENGESIPKAVDFSRMVAAASPKQLKIINQDILVFGSQNQAQQFFQMQGNPHPQWSSPADPSAGFEIKEFGMPQIDKKKILEEIKIRIPYKPLRDLTYFPLDQEVDDLSVGAKILLLLQVSENESGLSSTYLFERTIDELVSAAVTVGAFNGGTTVVKLDDILATEELTPPLYTDIRTVEFFEVVGESFILTTPRAAASGDGSCLFFYGESHSYKELAHRALQLVKKDTIEQVRAFIPQEYMDSGTHATLRPVHLDPPLKDFTLEDFPLEKPEVSVYGNLIEATQGKVEKEAVLGNGDNREKFQTFKLPKAPLTYLVSGKDLPPEVPKLEVYVDERLWKRVPTFFNHRPKEEIYIVREDADGDSWVQFGDGKTGARLPSGVDNVVVVYRTGIGAYGPLKEGTTVQAGDRLDDLDEIHLQNEASGGSQPESGGNAKAAAPGKVQSLGRLVSLQDYESEALAIAGVSKVTAAWDLSDNIPDIEMTILMETKRGSEFQAVERILNKYNICRGPNRHAITARQGKRLYVYTDLIFALDPSFREDTVKKVIKEALGLSGEEGDGVDGSGGLFAIYNRTFGQDGYATRITGIVQNVPGVIWVEVNKLGILGEADDPSTLSILPQDKQLNLIVACDTLHILSLFKSHLSLGVVKANTPEVC